MNVLKSYYAYLGIAAGIVIKLAMLGSTALAGNWMLELVAYAAVSYTHLDVYKRQVEFLYESGAKEVHMRSACPPIMYGCKYLNFSSSNSEMELLARRTVQELEGDEGQKHLEEYADANTKRGQCMLKTICEKFGFSSLGYQSLDGLLEAIGLDHDKVCTYCWSGKE